MLEENCRVYNMRTLRYIPAMKVSLCQWGMVYSCVMLTDSGLDQDQSAKVRIIMQPLKITKCPFHELV